MEKRGRSGYSRAAIAADALAITHLLLATVLVILGEITTIFSYLMVNHPGIAFVLRFLDAPVYYIVRPFFDVLQEHTGVGSEARGEAMYTYLFALAVIIISSVVYGIVAYFILKFLSSLFASDDV